MKLVLILLLAFFAIFSHAAELKPYRVYLKPGTVLTRLSDKKSFAIERGIYANVLESNPSKRDHFLVYDKNGKAIYDTLADGVVEIEKDVQILPNVDAEISYPPPSQLKANNKYAFFDTQFNLHLERLGMAPLNSIYNQELTSAVGNRWEIRTLYVSTLPVNFGLGINYQTATWENDIDEVKLSILSFGPQIQRYIYQGETTALSLHMGGEFAPIYTTSSGTSKEKYQAILFDLGLEALWDSGYGKWTVGTHYRRHDLTLTSTTRPGSNPVPEELVINSIGAMVGYKYEWDL